MPAQYAGTVAEQCREPHIHTVAQGDGSKSFAVLEELLTKMLELGFTRGDCVCSVGGGVVKVTMNGEKQVEALSIDKAAVDPEDVEMLQDLLVSAVNECGKKVDDMMQREMAKLTSGLGLPPGMI